MKKKLKCILSNKLFRSIAAGTIVIAAVVGIVSSDVFAQEDIIIENNIAPEATVSADYDWWYDNNGYGKNLLNNKLNDDNFYSSSEKANATDEISPLVFAWDEVQMIDEVQLYPFIREGTVYGMPQKYSISVSLDGYQYTLVKKIESDNNQDFDARCIKFSPQTCKYVKIDVEQLGFKDSANAETQGNKYALQLREVVILKSADYTTVTSADNIASLATIECDVINTGGDPLHWAANLQPEKLADKTVGCNNSYSSNFATEQTTKEIIFHYQKAYDVEEVVLYPYYNHEGKLQGFPKKFTVSVYDGTKWQTVAEEENTSTDVKSVHISAGNIACTKVKIEATELGASYNANEPYNLQLSEIAIIAKVSRSGQKLELENNIALNAVKISGEEVDWSDALKLSNLNDDTIGTSVFNTGAFYTSNYEDSATTTKEVTFELDKQQSIHEVRLYPQISGDKTWGMPTDFKISISCDGEKYWTVAQKTGYDNTSMDACIVQFPVVNCKYVKITATKLGLGENSANQYALQLTEVAIIKDTTDGIETHENNIADKAILEGEVAEWAKVDYALSKLVDKTVGPHSSYTSEFTSNQTDAKTITFKYDKAQNVQKVILYPYYNDNGALQGFPEEFEVSVYDGSSWIEIPSDKIRISGTKLTTVQVETVCNAVKIEATKLGNSNNSNLPYNLQLSEIAIIGTESNVQLKSNIADKATIAAEEVDWGDGGYSSQKLNDKKLDNLYSTFYEKSQNTVKTVQFNFKEAYKMDKVVLYPRLKDNQVVGFPIDFTVSVWDGNAWKNVATKTGVTTTGAYVIDFAEIDGKAVKVEVTKLGASDNEGEFVLQLAEVEIYGCASGSALPDAKNPSDSSTDNNQPDNNQPDNTIASIKNNIAPLAKIEAESPEWAQQYNLGTSKLVNLTVKEGDFYTSAFAKEQATTKNIYFTYDKAYKISEVKVYPRVDTKGDYGYPVDFTVSLWTGEQWKTVASKTGIAGSQPITVKFAATDCRGVRIRVEKLGPSDNKEEPYALMLSEVVIIGKESSAKMDAALTNVSDEQLLISKSRNIAYQCPVTVSSDYSEFLCGKENINDGDVSTTWATNAKEYKSGRTEWAEINLMENYYIDTIILGARKGGWGFPNDFTISVFYDGEWTDVVTMTDFQLDKNADEQLTVYTFKISKILGNKIRISSNNYRDAGVDKIMCITELAAYGTIATGKILPNENYLVYDSVLKASTTIEDYGYYLNNLTDGDYSTEYSSVPTTSATEQQIIDIGLFRELTISEIQMKPAWGGNGFPVDFSISVCENGKWVTVYEVQGYEKPADEAIQRFQFDGRKITDIRITVTKMSEFGGMYSVKLAEVMAYREHTGDDFDLDAVKNVVYEKHYEPATYRELEETADSKKTFPIASVAVGALFLALAVAGTVFMFKGKGKDKE